MKTTGFTHTLFRPLRIIVISALTLIVAGSCQCSSHRQSDRRAHDEKLAASMLLEARQQFEQGRYEEARKTIVLMRDTCRYALTAREKAILLLDSIELFQVRNDTISKDREIKEKFYLKKLEHDRMQLKEHE